MTQLRRSTRIANAKKAEVSNETPKIVTKKVAKKTKPSDKKKEKILGTKKLNSKITSKEKESAPKIEPKEDEGKNEDQSDIDTAIMTITLKNQDGHDVLLKNVIKENRIVVLFAYPRASTPGCTRQACGMRDNYDDLKSHAAVYGLSSDSVSAQKKFQTKQHLPYDLLSDPQRELIGLLGCKKTPQSGTIRSHFVFVDGKLKFKRIKISPEVSVSDCKKEVLEVVKSWEK